MNVTKAHLVSTLELLLRKTRSRVSVPSTAVNKALSECQLLFSFQHISLSESGFNISETTQVWISSLNHDNLETSGVPDYAKKGRPQMTHLQIRAVESEFKSNPIFSDFPILSDFLSDFI